MGRPNSKRAPVERATAEIAQPAAERPVADPRLQDGSLPAAWADFRFTPPACHTCSSCGRNAFWGDESGWRCATCHPTITNGARAVRVIDTRAPSP